MEHPRPSGHHQRRACDSSLQSRQRPRLGRSVRGHLQRRNCGRYARGFFCRAVHIRLSLLDEDPLLNYYTVATSGNNNEIKVWTMSARNRPKHEVAGSAISLVLKDTYDGHFSAVTCVRFNNTGTLLLSSSLDKLVKMWNESGACVATLDGHTRYVNCVAFTRDSLLAASGMHFWYPWRFFCYEQGRFDRFE